MFPATPGMLDLVNQAKAEGYAVFWITGRGDSQHQATIANLQNDTAAGLPDITTVTLNGYTIPEVDANYPVPTPINVGHGGFADGLFTKPPVGSYPAYLDTPESCGPYIHATPPRFRVRPSSTSPGRAPTSSRRATTSSPTSATSSAISWAATRTRRSRCRTRTTTSRRQESESKNSSNLAAPLRDTRPRGSGGLASSRWGTARLARGNCLGSRLFWLELPLQARLRSKGESGGVVMTLRRLVRVDFPGRDQRSRRRRPVRTDAGVRRPLRAE